MTPKLDESQLVDTRAFVSFPCSYVLLTRNHPNRIATNCRYRTAESFPITDSDGTVTQACFPKAGRISAEGTVTSEIRIVEIIWIPCMEPDISSRWLNGSLCIVFHLECILLHSTAWRNSGALEDHFSAVCNHVTGLQACRCLQLIVSSRSANLAAVSRN